MDKIGKSLDIKTRGNFLQLSESARQGEEQRKPSTSHPIWELWSVLSEYYGSAFVSQYGPEPSHTWAHMLRDLTQADYVRGIELLTGRESAFPPNPGEFLQMIGNDNSWERQCHKDVYRSPMLEDKTANEKRAAEGLSMIRKLRAETGL